MARIELVNLNKSFGAVHAVKDLNFAIEDGEFVVFVGPSGCGKTTTLRMIAGFEDPSSGEIRIDGRVVNDLEPRDRGLGMVFQSHALFPHKNVAQNIEFGLRMKKVPPERARQARARSRGDGAHRRTCSTRCRASARAANRSASRWRARWSPIHPPSCSTSRCRASTPNCGASCARNATGCTRRSSAPSSTSRTTRKRR